MRLRGAIFFSATLLTQLALFFSYACSAVAFLPGRGGIASSLPTSTRTIAFQEKTTGDEDDRVVRVGSREYLEGFLSSPIRDDTVREGRRGSGLEQALKLGGSATMVLVLLFLGFMASNGLL
jgi:hypothetical protein